MLQRLFNKTGYLFPSYFPQLIPRFYLLLIEARTACDVWNTATHLFVVVTSTKLSRLRHDLSVVLVGASAASMSHRRVTRE